MRRIIEYARKRGIGEIFGDVLRENTRMLQTCKKLGFIAGRGFRRSRIWCAWSSTCAESKSTASDCLNGTFGSWRRGGRAAAPRHEKGP